METIETKLPDGLKAEFLPIIERLIESGVSENQIPFILGAEEKHSLVQWQSGLPEIKRLFDNAREKVLNKLEGTLLIVALGGVLREKTTKTTRKGTTETVKIKEVSPNLDAIQYILENQRPEVWKNRKTITVNTGNLTGDNIAEADVQSIRRWSGKLLEGCTEGLPTECTVQREPQSDTWPGQRSKTGVCDDVSTESAPGIQDAPMDLQPKE